MSLYRRLAPLAAAPLVASLVVACTGSQQAATRVTTASPWRLSVVSPSDGDTVCSDVRDDPTLLPRGLPEAIVTLRVTDGLRPPCVIPDVVTGARPLTSAPDSRTPLVEATPTQPWRPFVSMMPTKVMGHPISYEERDARGMCYCANFPVLESHSSHHVGNALIALGRGLDDPDIEGFVSSTDFGLGPGDDGWLDPRFEGLRVPGATPDVMLDAVRAAYADTLLSTEKVGTKEVMRVTWSDGRSSVFHAHADWLVKIDTARPGLMEQLVSLLPPTDTDALRQSLLTPSPTSAADSLKAFRAWAEENDDYIAGDIEELKTAIGLNPFEVEVAATHWQVDGEANVDWLDLHQPAECYTEVHDAYRQLSATMRDAGERIVSGGIAGRAVQRLVSQVEQQHRDAKRELRRARCS